MTVFIHILTTYLSSNAEKSAINQATAKKYTSELNDLVLKKLINLGTNHKQDFKQVLNKWPELKTKIENAFKLSVNSNTSTSPEPVSTTNSQHSQVTNVKEVSLGTPASSQKTKAPKIQLKTFGNFK